MMVSLKTNDPSVGHTRYARGRRMTTVRGGLITDEDICRDCYAMNNAAGVGLLPFLCKESPHRQCSPTAAAGKTKFDGAP